MTMPLSLCLFSDFNACGSNWLTSTVWHPSPPLHRIISATVTDWAPYWCVQSEFETIGRVCQWDYCVCVLFCLRNNNSSLRILNESHGTYDKSQLCIYLVFACVVQFHYCRVALVQRQKVPPPTICNSHIPCMPTSRYSHSLNTFRAACTFVTSQSKSMYGTNYSGVYCCARAP